MVWCLQNSDNGLSLIISQHITMQEALRTQFICEIISMPKLQRAEMTEMSIYLYLITCFMHSEIPIKSFF